MVKNLVLIIFVSFTNLVQLAQANEKLACVFPVGNEYGEGWVNDQGRKWLDPYMRECKGVNRTNLILHTAYDFNLKDTYCNDDIGNPVHAIANGVVALIRKGGAIYIRHNFGGELIISKYVHLGNITNVRVGDNVKMGDQLGTVGNIGTTCAHLHMEIYREKKAGLKPELPCWKTKNEILKTWLDPIKFLRTCQQRHFAQK